MSSASTIIPVVLSADNNYLSQAVVVICSVLEHAGADDEYVFYIFGDEDLPRGDRAKVQKFIQSYPRAKLEFINVRSYLPSAKAVGYFSVAAYYRLLIPVILSQYPKAVYLDCDVVVKHDLSELFHIDLGGKLVGGCQEWILELSDKLGLKNTFRGKTLSYKDYHLKVLNIPSSELGLCINTGVMIYDIQAIQPYLHSLWEKMLSEVSEGYLQLDQDLVNRHLRNYMKILPADWNYRAIDYNIIHTAEQSNIPVFTDNPALIHFVSGKKPWNSDQVNYSDQFWEYCRKTPFYFRLRGNYLSALLEKMVYRYNRPEASSLPGAIIKITFYGIRAVAKRLCRRAKRHSASSSG